MKKLNIMNSILVLLILTLLSGCSMTGGINTTGTDHKKDGGVTIDTADNGKGLLVQSSRSLDINLKGSDTLATQVVGVDSISLQDIRNEITEAGMALKTFMITNLLVKGLPEYQTLANMYGNKIVVLKMFTEIAGDPTSRELAIETPVAGDFYPQETFASIHAGIELNKGLYSAPGFKSFETIIKKGTAEKMIVTIELNWQEPVAIPNDFKLTFSLFAESKINL